VRDDTVSNSIPYTPPITRTLRSLRKWVANQVLPKGWDPSQRTLGDVLWPWNDAIQTQTRIPNLSETARISMHIASQVCEICQKHESTMRRTSFESKAAKSLVPPIRFSLRIAPLNFSRSNKLLSPS